LSKIRKLLIANRGEIAERVIRTAKRLKIQTVVVYSDADINMPFVKLADEAVNIGPPPVSQSYLKIDKIIEVAKNHKVDAIHPGYGLLSENPHFAKRVEEEGLIFIGPKHEKIALMGDKLKARLFIKEQGVPIVPGTLAPLSSIEEALDFAKQVGYPILIKASFGGGGIGMQKIDSETSLEKMLISAKEKAKAYFGNDEVFIEKYIENPHHIEVQVFGDKYGNVVHLFERECSVQRRHQKVIEETPSPFLSNEVRDKLLAQAVNATKAIGYEGAGTIEFIVDRSQNFYFLEMNTRLQVEHPITEETTGIDIVEWQVKIAEGEQLPLKQDEIRQIGHAIEFRLYAEDPVTFYPAPGKITTWNLPKDVRVDSGYEKEQVVTPYYDPLLAKIIVNGNNRLETITKSKEILKNIEVSGIKVNLPFLQKVLESPDFVNGDYNTNLINRMNNKNI